MANYLLKYKGKYRILPTLDEITHDLPRQPDGSIEDTDIYITCQNDNRIYCYGHYENSKAVWLMAYIPSIGRGRNIKKVINELGIEYKKYIETDSEVEFIFKSKDVDTIAKLLKAKTSGANISPFSVKNLPKANVEIPSDKIEQYKKITSIVQQSDLLIIHKLTLNFLNTVLQKKIKKNDKSFNYKTDMKKLMMGRLAKEYIYIKGYWDDYLVFLNKELEAFYKKGVN